MSRTALWVDLRVASGARLVRLDLDGDGDMDVVVMPAGPGLLDHTKLGSRPFAWRCGVGPCPGSERMPFVVLRNRASGLNRRPAIRVSSPGTTALSSLVTAAALVDQQVGTGGSEALLVVDRSFGGVGWRDTPLLLSWPEPLDGASPEIALRVVAESAVHQAAEAFEDALPDWQPVAASDAVRLDAAWLTTDLHLGRDLSALPRCPAISPSGWRIQDITPLSQMGSVRASVVHGVGRDTIQLARPDQAAQGEADEAGVLLVEYVNGTHVQPVIVHWQEAV
jgi:hypothetical protein